MKPPVPDDPADLLNFLPVDGFFAASNFKPIEFGRIMAARDLNSASNVEVVGGEGKTGSGTHADSDDMTPGGAQSFPHGLVKCGRGEAVIAAEGDARAASAAEVRTYGMAENPDGFRCQIPINNASDVVFAKNLGIE